MFNKSGIIFKGQMEGDVVVLAVYKSEKLTNLWLKRKEKRRPGSHAELPSDPLQTLAFVYLHK